MRVRALAEIDANEPSSRVLRIIIGERCADDRWAPPAIACFAKASTYEALRACDDQLTDEQRRMLRIAEATVIQVDRELDAADAIGDAGVR